MKFQPNPMPSSISLTMVYPFLPWQYLIESPGLHPPNAPRVLGLAQPRLPDTFCAVSHKPPLLSFADLSDTEHAGVESEKYP